MSAPIYYDRVKKMIDQLYEPGEPGELCVKMTTTEIYLNLCTIIPSNAFDEFDLVEALEELGFEPRYESKEREVEREVVADKGEVKAEKFIEEYDDLRYYWYMRKKS